MIMALGENIKKLRKKLHMTQNELAEKAGISRVTIGFYERGDQEPPASRLIQICNALNVTPNELLDFEFKNNEQEKIIKLCEDCGLTLDFCGNYEDDTVYISDFDDNNIVWTDPGEPEPPPVESNDFVIPAKDFFALVKQVITSAQFHAKLRESLITVFSQYELKRLQRFEALQKQRKAEAGDAATATTKTTTSKQLQNDEN